MRFTVEFDMDNGAFEESPYMEACRVTRAAVDAAVSTGHMPQFGDDTNTRSGEGVVKDSNGNTIGRWMFTADE